MNKKTIQICIESISTEIAKYSEALVELEGKELSQQTLEIVRTEIECRIIALTTALREISTKFLQKTADDARRRFE